MRAQLPILRGTRPGTGPSYPRRDYVYAGSIPLDKDPDILARKRRPDAPPCSVDGCSVQAHARGYCPTHYYEQHRKVQP